MSILLCYADTCSPFGYMLPKLAVKTASADNAPSISKSFVALSPPPVVNGNADAVAQSQPSTTVTADGRGGHGHGPALARESSIDTAAPPPPPPRRLPSPPVTERSQSQPGWHVVSTTLNSPRQRRCRPPAASRLRGLDVDSGSVQERPSLKTSSSADWLRLLEKLGDTQFGEVPYAYAVHTDIKLHSYWMCFQASQRLRELCAILLNHTPSTS